VDFTRRLIGLQHEMTARDIDLVVYGACQNYQYLTGLGPGWRSPRDDTPVGDVVFVPREGDPVLTLTGGISANAGWIEDVRPIAPGESLEELVQAIMNGLRLEVRTIGLGRHLPGPVVVGVSRAAGNPAFVDASGLMDRTRSIKEPEEIELLRRAARLTDRVMETVIAGIREGVTERELNLAIEMQARRMGASHVSFPPCAGFVKSGSTGSDPLSDYPQDKGLEPHTAIFFDVGFVLDGYCSDWGRSVFWGVPQQHAVKGHQALRQAVLETVGAMRDGTRACDVYPAIEAVLDRLGYGGYLRARLGPANVVGHQIGVEVHENPWLRPDNLEPLREGMVMCLEPKLWHAGEYYFRLEEMVLIGKHGAELLTDFDRELFRL
jgi:Xaa-Pro aminopeptidase